MGRTTGSSIRALIHWHLWAVWLQLDGLGYVRFRLTTEEVELYLEILTLGLEANASARSTVRRRWPLSWVPRSPG